MILLKSHECTEHGGEACCHYWRIVDDKPTAGQKVFLGETESLWIRLPLGLSHHPTTKIGWQTIDRYFLASHPTQEALISLNRRHNSWNVLFPSDIFSANGKFLYQHCLHPPNSRTKLTSKFSFACHQQETGLFGKQSGNSIAEMDWLPYSPDSWIESSHITWELFWDESLQLVRRRHSKKIEYLFPAASDAHVHRRLKF